MDDEAAKVLAGMIMREQNVDNLEGFGQITMKRIEQMLMDAAKSGYIVGYSDGFKEAEG